MEFYDFPFNWECHHPNSLSLTFFPTSLCGVLVFGCALPPASRLHAPPPTHNLFSTHNLSTHNLLTHNLLTHHLLTHNLSRHTTCHHTTCSHTTYSHTTCHHTTYSHTQLVHTLLTQLTHTQLVHTQLTHTQLHRPSLCMAGVALGDIDLHFARQAWHLWPWTGSGGALGCFGRRGCLHGRHGTWRHRPSLCMQAWHLVTSTFT